MTLKKAKKAKTITLSEEALSKLISQKIAEKTSQAVVSSDLKLSPTKWQTLSGHYGNQVSLAPFSKGGKYDTPAVTVKMTQSATKSGFDRIRAELDIAENKLDEAGILTA